MLRPQNSACLNSNFYLLHARFGAIISSHNASVTCQRKNKQRKFSHDKH
nr:MAG TPA: hypothetical protein [Caudoviricetes sp.]